MKHLFLLFILVSFSLKANSIKVSGKVVDAFSKKGIPNVHVYSSKSSQGTISNADGNFSLISFKNDKLNISCLGYESQTIILNKDNLKGTLKIELLTQTEMLDEVVINTKTISADIILDNVFKNFKKNHFVEPVYYNFYTRITEYTRDSTLICLEEYSGLLNQATNHSTKYNVEKARVKYFTKDAEKKLKEHRLISMSKTRIDNIFIYREDYMKRKGKRKYTYKFIKKVDVFGRDCYEISFEANKDTYHKRGLLYIDSEDFAIARKVTFNKKNKKLNDITFNKQKGKWYLKKSEDFHSPYRASIPTTDYRITLYNYLDVEKLDVNFSSLNVQKSSKITSNFNDEFWENTNFIPLPNWIKTQMK